MSAEVEEKRHSSLEDVKYVEESKGHVEITEDAIAVSASPFICRTSS